MLHAVLSFECLCGLCKQGWEEALTVAPDQFPCLQWNKLNLASMHTDDADLGANANMQHRARGMKITQHNQRAKKNVSISLQTSPAVATETSLASVAGNARLGSSLVSMESGGGRRGGVTPILRTMSTGSTQKGTASHKGGDGAGGGDGGGDGGDGS